MILRLQVWVISAGLFCGYCSAVLAQNAPEPAKQAIGTALTSAPAETKAMASNSSAPTAAANSGPNSAAAGKTASPAGAAAPSASPASSASEADPDTKTPPPDPSVLNGIKVDPSYIVGVADSLFISVWKEPDLSGPAVVRPDGIITLPVVGDVHVAGLTTPQVQDLLTTKLKDVVAEPQVTVVVRDIRSRKAYLVGKVSRPGAVLLTSPETVLQLLTEAGGPNQFAKPQNMYLLRTVDGHQKRIPFNYRKVVEGKQPDIPIVVGDIIVVP